MRLPALLVSAAFAVACSDVAAPSRLPASLTLVPDSPRVLVDSNLQLSVTARDHDGSVIANPVLGWLVFDTIVAQVNTGGLLSGKSLGASSLIVASGDAFVQVPIATVTRIAQIAVGTLGSCSLAPGGTAYCWGRDLAGPARVPGGRRFQTTGAGNDQGCGLDLTGSAYCWFIDSAGPPRGPQAISTPVTVGGPPFTRLAVGYYYTCGLTATGSAYCWQIAFDQQDNDSSFTPAVALSGLTFTNLSSTFPACGIVTGGQVYCWGRTTTAPWAATRPVSASITANLAARHRHGSTARYPPWRSSPRVGTTPVRRRRWV